MTHHATRPRRRARQRLRRPARHRRLAVGVRHRLRGPAGRRRHDGARRRRPGRARGVLPDARRRRAGPARTGSREWCSNAPDLEEDIALANIALDLLGQARLLLARAAAAADPRVVPALPEGSPVPAEDALAFFREAVEFRNVRLVEVANGDFAAHIARLLLFATVRLARSSGWPPPRPGAGGDRGQGRQGAGLPPRLRRPLVPDPGPGHRGVPRLPADAAWPRRAVLAAVERRVAHGVGVDRRRAARSTSSSTRSSRSAASSAPRPAAGARPHRRTAAHRGALPDARRDAGRGPRPPEGPVVTTVDAPRTRSRPRSATPRCRCSPWRTSACCATSAAERRSVTVTITPTYSGCPAMATMRDDLVHRLADAGYDAAVEVALTPRVVERLDHRARPRSAGRARPLRAGPGPAVAAARSR